MKYILLILITIFMCVSVPSYAEGPIRERIRSNMKERFVEKLDTEAAPAANASVDERITRSGDYYFAIQHQGLDRQYLVHVPPSYRRSVSAPVVFAFHGGGGDMNYMANDEYYGLVSKSNKEGFIAVFPNGYSRFKSGKLATWNAGSCCGDARDKNIDDVGFVRAIVAHLHQQMNIDRNRIYATGMSNGAMMSYRLACEASDIFAAVAAVAGTDNFRDCSPQDPVSILHIHALNDTHVLFNGGAGKDAFRDISKVTEFVSVPATIQKWADLNQCDVTPQRVLNTKGAYCDIYSSCNGGAAVKLCVTEAGGHSWPGGYKPRGDEPPSQVISANDQMWDFFSKLR